MDSEDTVTIPRDTYIRLCEAEAFLQCLRAAGVDNWEGYEQAIEMNQQDED